MGPRKEGDGDDDVMAGWQKGNAKRVGGDWLLFMV